MSELRACWRSLAYLRGMTRLPDEVKSYSMNLTFDQRESLAVDAINIFLMNGSLFGCGYKGSRCNAFRWVRKS